MGMPTSALADFSRVNTPQALIHMWVFCRIDYHLATPAIAALARSEHIYKEARFSDHAPMSVD